ncbi:MAG: DUF493 domain-containing protein [Gammaproteobacteria bacterium]|nr:DUF493 domain-containing protein [Gammaproteobacteria bacterium]
MMKASALDLLEYPCQFPLKVVGKNSSEFEGMVTRLVRQHVAQQHQIKVKQTPSKKNNYVSVTLTFEADSCVQLETIYKALYDCPEVVMTL